MDILPGDLIKEFKVNDHTRVPVKQVKFLYNYFVESFPLYQPIAEDPKTIGNRLESYMQKLSKYTERSMYYDKSLVVRLNIKTDRRVIDVLVEIIVNAFPNIKTEMINRQFKRLDSEYHCFSSSTAIYNGLWKQFIKTSSIRTKLDRHSSGNRGADR